MSRSTVRFLARPSALFGVALALAQACAAAAVPPDAAPGGDAGADRAGACAVGGCGTAVREEPRRRTAPDPAAAGQPRPASPWGLTLSGYALHFRDKQCKSCERTDWVPGIGVSYRLHGDDASPWSAQLAAGVQNDSFRNLGYYAGANAQRLHRAAWGTLGYGLGVFALRRTFSSRGELEWMVAPLPVLSFAAPDGRWGLNVLAAPDFRHNGKTRSGFVFFQLSYRFAAGAGH